MFDLVSNFHPSCDLQTSTDPHLQYAVPFRLPIFDKTRRVTFHLKCNKENYSKGTRKLKHWRKRKREKKR